MPWDIGLVHANNCLCISDVMGSEDWVAPDEGPMAYDSGGNFYWTPVALGPQRMYWPVTSNAFQSIQVTVTNFGPRVDEGGDILELWARSIDTSTEDSGIQFFARKYEDSADGPLWAWSVQANNTFIYSPPGDFPSGLLYWPYGDLGDSTTFRLESDADGAFRIYVNGSLLYGGTFVGLSIDNTYVGFSGERYTGSTSEDVMHVSNICVKECGETECVPLSMIYKIVGNPAQGDTIPNLGTYTSAPLYVRDFNNSVGTDDYSQALNFSLGSEELQCNDPARNYWTVLFRIGDIQSAADEVQSTVNSGFQSGAECLFWLVHYGIRGPNTFGDSEFYEMVVQNAVNLTTLETPWSNGTWMMSVNRDTGAFRVVKVTGGVVSTPPGTFVYNSSLFGSFRVRIYPVQGYINGAFHDWGWIGVNGFGQWNEECVSDADFLALYNEFAAA